MTWTACPMTYDRSIKRRAKKMRQRGLSLNEISKSMNIAKSTLSLWLRKTEISEQGKDRLGKRRSVAHNFNSKNANKQAQAHYRKIREKAYNEGFNNPVSAFDALCVGLYWGEGSKSAKTWEFCNSNIETIKIMIKWAISKGQNKKAFSMQIQVHPEDLISDNMIKKFWSKSGVPINNIRVYRNRTSSSKMYSKRKLPYGTCRVYPLKNGARLFSYYEGQRDAMIKMIQ